MGYFRVWLENKEQVDVQKTIAKLPKRHQELVRGYEITFEGGNTMKQDDEHIGLVKDSPKKVIVVAAPWNYPREYALLHEIAHLVWATFVTPQMKVQWAKLVSRNKPKEPQNDEEEFCMSYAQHFANNQIVKYEFPERDKFIKFLIQHSG